MHLNKCVFCVKRIPKDRSSSVLCIVNVTDEEVELNFSPKTGEEDKTSFVNLIGGQTYKTENGMLQCSLKPYQIIWLEES
jgi:hypothetical protein